MLPIIKTNGTGQACAVRTQWPANRQYSFLRERKLPLVVLALLPLLSLSETNASRDLAMENVPESPRVRLT